MFMCDVTKTPPYARYFVAVNYCLFANGDVSIRFNGKDDNNNVAWCSLLYIVIYTSVRVPSAFGLKTGLR